MAKYEMNLSLPNAPSQYVQGDTVQCRLDIDVQSKLNSKSVTLKLFWRTHGLGNRSWEFLEEFICHRGALGPGMHSFEHCFVPLSGPPTYRGTVMNIDWYVSATMDVPWAFDPLEEVDFLVTRNTDPKYLESAKDTVSSESSENASNSKVAFIVIGAFLAIFIAMGLSLFISGLVESRFAQSFAGIVFTIFPALLGLLLIWNNIASRRFSHIEICLDREILTAGDAFEAELHFICRKDTSISGIKLTLEGKEQTVSGSGTNSVTHTHSLHKQSHTLEHRHTGKKGMPFSEKVQFSIPSEAAPSIAITDNEISWSLQATIEIDNWPDYTEVKTIQVL